MTWQSRSDDAERLRERVGGPNVSDEQIARDTPLLREKTRDVGLSGAIARGVDLRYPPWLC